MDDHKRISDKKAGSQCFYTILLISAILFGLAYSTAQGLLKEGHVRVSIEKFLLGAFFFAALTYGSCRAAKLFPCKDNCKVLHFQKKRELVFFLIYAFAYCICWLTFFPGVGMNDGLNIMYFGKSTATQFPIAYVVIVMGFREIGRLLGNLQWGIALYSLFQIFVVSILEAVLTEWIWDKTECKVFRYGTIFYLAGVPLFPMYAVSMLKDTVWSLFIVCFVVYLYEIVFGAETEKDRWFWAGFDFTLLCILLLRNNGAYIILPVIAMLIIFAKYSRKRIALSLFLAILVLTVNSLIFVLAGKKALFQEKAGILIQQIAAVMTSEDGVISDDQLAFMDRIMPEDEIRARYNPSTVDPIKWGGGDLFDRKFLNEHSGEFIDLWIQLLPANFEIYVKAYLQQTLGFWAPMNYHKVQCFFSIETFADNDWLVAFCEDNGIHDEPLLPPFLNTVLRKYYDMAPYFLL